MNKLLKKHVETINDAQKQKLMMTDDGIIEAKRKILPPFNLNAKVQDAVYDKYMLMRKEDMENLYYKQLYKEINKNGEATQETRDSREYEWISVNLMETLVYEKKEYEAKKSGSADVEEEQQKFPHLKYRVQSCLFMGYLLKFYKMRDKEITNIEKEKKLEQEGGQEDENSQEATKEDISHVVKQNSKYLIMTSLRDRFSEATIDHRSKQGESKFRYVKNQVMKDKLICHIIVLMLMIKNYRFDAAWLANMLKVEITTLVKYLKETGCYPLLKGEGEEDPLPE